MSKNGLKKTISEKTKNLGNNKLITKKGSIALLGLLVFASVMTASGLIYGKVSAAMPYAFVVDDKDVCYVDNKEAAEEVIETIVANNTVEGTEVKAVKITGLEMEQKMRGKVDPEKMMNVEEAAKYLEDTASNNHKFDIRIASTITETETFTPEPILVENDDMFAGESAVVEEGRDGEKKVSTIVTVIDGNIAEEEITDTEIIDEGKQTTIAKGTLGLPRGADWKTYEGDPVFNNAEDLIKTCKKYIGAPYKYGGHSLTNGIDCVQYVRQMFAKYGIYIPNKHSDIQKVGKAVSLKDAQPGDIVCWTHHVGIYIGNGKVINATRKKGVTISSVHMNKKLVTIRRVPRN